MKHCLKIVLSNENVQVLALEQGVQSVGTKGNRLDPIVAPNVRVGQLPVGMYVAVVRFVAMRIDDGFLSAWCLFMRYSPPALTKQRLCRTQPC